MTTTGVRGHRGNRMDGTQVTMADGEVPWPSWLVRPRARIGNAAPRTAIFRLNRVNSVSYVVMLVLRLWQVMAAARVRKAR
jgi:hypothetical protein